MEDACHSDCSGHTGTLEPHTDDSWSHATYLDTPGILMTSRLKLRERGRGIGKRERRNNARNQATERGFPVLLIL